MASSSSSSAAPRPKSRTRLFLSSLPANISEAALAALATPFGPVADLHLAVHGPGPLKGRPRGYAFVEYRRAEDADVARRRLDGRTLAGRTLAAAFADERLDDASSARRARTVPSKAPTTLSLVKNASRPQSTDAKIEAMEAKLAAMRARSSSTGAVAPAASSAAPSTIVSASAAAQAQLPRRPPPGASKRP
ncbi:hypothetical protein FA09DRAFT_360346 [Tilletiopsis washingtonensis]|uniref:RRM domain-containing protein n=1 Tax=Tilletiopsis washingtonensis TaxID=58919 RepID=A0A316Z8X4_9BASI|nr:hypothetical protein FA09DRAFT_360346 [Tilletiopsis washingtonensis]PWN98049.1 hypothetical protein FA09DRAFT_360346 [Tilletiopsis washingtonensis]